MLCNIFEKKGIRRFLAAISLTGIVSAAAWGMITQLPLYLATTEQPNIMLLLDSSGSMNIIMFHSGYDPKVMYSGIFQDGDTYYQFTNNGKHYLSNMDGSGDYIVDDGSGTFSIGSNAPASYDGRKVKLPLPYDNTRWDGRYLNWIFFHATPAQYNTLGTDPPLQKTRIQTARSVISDLVKKVSGVRFGLSHFDIYGNAKVVANCGSLTAANVDTTVTNIGAGTWTPLGQALADIWDYFKGSGYTSPIISACQKNFVIVVTDGEPTYDGCYTGDFSMYGCNKSLNAPSRLADVAGYMHTHDASAAFASQQTVETYTIGLTFHSLLLEATAANGGGKYYTTLSGIDLSTAMQSAVQTIINSLSSSSAAAVNTGFLTSDTSLYRARFNSGDWVGFLEAFSLNPANGDIVGYPSTPKWEAGMLLNANSARTIYTAGPVGSGYKRYTYTTGNATVLAGAGFMNFSSAKASTMIGYIRGDSSPAGYRARSSKLGDMINSNPVVYGPPDGFYTEDNYAGFKTAWAGRKPLVLIGANDGMLHAFDAKTGTEEWAFIPNTLLPKLKQLRNIPYSHQNYVNGTITVGDAFIASKDTSGNATAASWRSVAVSGLREGGKSFFALDITNPAAPIPLWEVTPTSPTANGLGYSFGTPLIVKMRDAAATGGTRWVALISNGYEGQKSGNSASLLILDLATGSIVKEIVVDITSNSSTYANGLASPGAVDVNADGFVDYVYAGDLRGRLWKFDLRSDKSSEWDVGFKYSAGTPVPLITATDPAGNRQPITTAPEIVLQGGSQVIFFATGKYIENSDPSSKQAQSVYGVYDSNPGKTGNNSAGIYSKADLVAQTLTEVTTAGGQSYRTTSDNPIISGKKGWYVNLPESGERVINDPVARADKLIFTTFTPNTAACSHGGTSWLMELNLLSGGTVTNAVFDTNNDGGVDHKDTVTPDPKKLPKYATGTRQGEGIASTPTIVGSGKKGVEYKYITKSNGSVSKVLEGGAQSRFGVRSWRQL